MLPKRADQAAESLPDGDRSRRVLGWAGLIPHVRLKRYERSAPLPDGLTGGGPGLAGAFERFLSEHPDIRSPINKTIIKGIGSGRIRAGKSTFKGVFKLFRRLCLERLRPDEYPRNMKDEGRRSLERYANKLINSDSRAIATWHGKDAADALRLGTGRTSFPFALAPFDVVGADAHKMHARGAIVVPGPAGPQAIPIRRVWIYADVDSVSHVVTGYSVAIRTEPCAANLEQAISFGLKPWRPRELRVTDLSYAPGAGFPAGVIDGITTCRPAVLMLDNAAQHFAGRIQDTLRRRVGCAVTWGPVGAWWRNAITERLFRTLELQGFQRLSSSTGSSPQDPLRGDSVANAVAHVIEWEELIDFVDVLFANYNAEPSKSLGNRSPLDVVRAHLEARRPAFVPRSRVPPTVLTPELGITVETHPLRAVRRHKRAVSIYVQIDGVRYSSPAVCHRFDLADTQVVLHIDESDMRSITAFLVDGCPLGTLVPLHPAWRITKHTRDMLKEINRLLGSEELDKDSPDIVLEYLGHLMQKSLEEARRHPRQVSSAATELAAAAQASGVSAAEVAKRRPNSTTIVPYRPIPDHIAKPSWSNF